MTTPSPVKTAALLSTALLLTVGCSQAPAPAIQTPQTRAGSDAQVNTNEGGNANGTNNGNSNANAAGAGGGATSAAADSFSPDSGQSEIVAGTGSEAGVATGTGSATTANNNTNNTNSNTPTPAPANPAPAPAPAPESTRSATPAQLTPVYRFYKAGVGHFYTSSEAEGTNAGFNLEGQAFSVLAAPIDGAEGIYRCITGSFHFVSIDPGCEGHTTEGIYGYVMAQQTADTAPLFRCVHNAANGSFDHLVELGNTAECTTANFTVEGGMGFAPLTGFIAP